MAIPKYHQLFNPTLQALRELGGSATNEELVEKVLSIVQLSEKDTNKPHLGSETQTEFGYRLAWAKTYLKKYGVITNSKRAIWTLTQKGKEIVEVDPKDVQKYVRLSQKTEVDASGQTEDTSTLDGEPIEPWREKTMKIIQQMDPSAFERLCQRLLRESGFVEVHVTGKSGDGGIDGHGVIRLQLISFRVVFQAKRYCNAVSANIVRDFRGAMSGRAEKGLLITTGRFTREAEKEAKRDGTPMIDLIDGDRLIDILCELELGIEKITDYKINEEWFNSI